MNCFTRLRKSEELLPRFIFNAGKNGSSNTDCRIPCLLTSRAPPSGVRPHSFPGLLQILLKNHVPLNSHGWYAADHYKTRLDPTLLDLPEAHVAQAAPDKVPQTPRDFQANRQQPILDLDVDRILAQWSEEPSAQAVAPQTLEAILTYALQRDILNPGDLDGLSRP